MSIYRRQDSGKYWFCCRINGRRYRQSTGLENREAAEAYEAQFKINARLRKVGLVEQPRFMVSELLDRLKVRWQLEHKATPQNLSVIKKAKADWGTKMADEVTVEQLQRYAAKRQREEYAASTTNRIFQVLRRAYHISDAPWPKFELLKEENRRTGFVEAAQMEKVLGNLSDDGLRDFVRFLHITGIRRGEAAALRWSFLQDGQIIVPAEFCKSRKPHVVPVAGPLVAIIERRKASRAFTVNGTARLSEYIFHRGDSLPVGDFKKSWKTACTKAGCGNLLVHDLRRAACRDMIRGGVPQSVAMRITGHETDAIFRRYAIVSDDDMAAALEKTEAFRAHARG